MSIATASLSTAAQALIDARLDVIERILMDRMGRQDRLTIVREVESQIHELLAERGVDEASREDVLAVLARLDPPEAYLSDEELNTNPVPRAATNPRPANSSATPKANVLLDFLAITSGILGIVAGLAGLLMSALSLMIVTRLVSQVPDTLVHLSFFGGASAILLASPCSLALSFYCRFQSRWAVFGLISSLFSMIAAIACTWFAFTA